MLKNSSLISVLLLASMQVYAVDYYTSTTGSDSAPGTLERPFLTVAKGVKQLAPGDRLFIRGGAYHETVVFKELRGSAADPIIIRSYPGEKVVMDGTEPLKGAWERHAGNVVKTPVNRPVWVVIA